MLRSIQIYWSSLVICPPKYFAIEARPQNAFDRLAVLMPRNVLTIYENNFGVRKKYRQQNIAKQNIASQ